MAVLIFHRVLAAADPLQPDEPTAAAFDWQVALLAREFNLLTISDAVDRLLHDRLPPRALCITFDDGYMNNHDVALPILQRWNARATFFVATAWLDGGVMWNDGVIEAIRAYSGTNLKLGNLGLDSYPMRDDRERKTAINSILRGIKHRPLDERSAIVSAMVDQMGVRLPDRLMMDDAQVRSLERAGMEIGAHTVNHPILTSLADQRARDEIIESKSALEAITGRMVCAFAFPNGVPGRDYSSQHLRFVREAGFDSAVSTAWGVADRNVDRYQIPRIAPWDRTPLRYQLRIALSLWGRSHERVT